IKCRGVVARATIPLQQPADFTRLCLAPSLEYLERAYDDAKYGRDSTAPYVEAAAYDVRLEVHAQYAPFAGAVPDPERHQALRERVAQLLGRAPDELTLETPDDLQARAGVTEGHLYHGELTLDQILFMRPVPGWSRYRTPLAGLYLCGPGTHPGGGIAGAAGRNAAGVILND
ncbi:MAG: hypothetical protein ACREU4_03410, partial [Burkholderiales bacterium]